jgi:sulfoxide reductase catalytic subunit YedY
MLIRRTSEIPSSEITPQSVYKSRRAFMAAAAAAGAAVAAERILRPGAVVHAETKLQTVQSKFSTPGLAPTSLRDITSYNNYYEFGTSKSDPSENAGKMQTYPWSVKVEGLVKKPKTYSAIELSIKEVEPLSSAKYVQFESYYNPDVMPWSREVGIDWPYTEGLRMDEAMHPLTLLTFGLYGETLPNQDGAPMRIVVPWKYGYKSAKSIVKIKFVAKQPYTTWMEQAPSEYGFYSNVNPNVDTVPWSQANERVIGAPIWKQRQATQMFNGYGDQVASLYAGMDLKKYY